MQIVPQVTLVETVDTVFRKVLLLPNGKKRTCNSFKIDPRRLAWYFICLEKEREQCGQ